MPTLFSSYRYPSWLQPVVFTLPAIMLLSYTPSVLSGPVQFPCTHNPQVYATGLPLLAMGPKHDKKTPRVKPEKKVHKLTEQNHGQKPAAAQPIATGKLQPPPGVKEVMLQPEDGREFCDLYITDGSTPPQMTSVNAGDPGLYVGGGGINQAFEQILKEDGTECTRQAARGAQAGDNGYQNQHKKLIDKAEINKFKLFTKQDSKGILTHPAIEAAGVLKDSISGVENAGTVIVDVFNDAHCPYKNHSNRSMTYIIPPCRGDHENDESFLSAVKKTAANMVKAVDNSNLQLQQSGLSELVTPVLRVCAFSSSIFAGGVSEKKVASAIKMGIYQQMTAGDSEYHGTINTIEYENNCNGAPFKNLSAQPSADSSKPAPHPSKKDRASNNSPEYESDSALSSEDEDEDGDSRSNSSSSNDSTTSTSESDSDSETDGVYAQRINPSSPAEIRTIYSEHTPVTQPAKLEQWKLPGGSGSATYMLLTDSSFNPDEDKITTVIAGNHGLPLGGLASPTALKAVITEKDLNKKTQEEAVAANWLLTACGNKIEDQNKLFKKTVCQQWGLEATSDKSTKTLQGIDYTKSKKSKDYRNAWLVQDAILSATAGNKLVRGTETPTLLVFTGGPNANPQIGGDTGTMKRTLNKRAIGDYTFFKACVKEAVKVALDAAIKEGSRHILLPPISCGLYAGSHKDNIKKEFPRIIEELLDEVVLNIDGGRTLRRKDYFIKVILVDIDNSTKRTQQKEYSQVNNYLKYSKKYHDVRPNDRLEFYDKHAPYYELTNFYQSPIRIDGKVWKTAEHYFQASKFAVGSEQWNKCFSMQYPSGVFKYAHENVGKMECSFEEWNAKKDRVMLKALRAKARQSLEFRETLISSGNKVLFEASPIDNYWGFGPKQKGQNRLGCLLMQVRDEIRAGLLPVDY